MTLTGFKMLQHVICHGCHYVLYERIDLVLQTIHSINMPILDQDSAGKLFGMLLT